MAKYPELNWQSHNISEEFKLFKQRMTLTFTDNEVNDKAKQSVKIKLAVGNEGLQRINTSGLSDADQDDPDKLWKLFEDQLKVKVNYRVHRLEFSQYRQQTNENLDTFVNRCRSKAKDCSFTAPELDERIIELVIASTPFEQFQRRLLEKEKGYTLKEMLEEGRQYEAILAGKLSIDNLGNSAIHAITRTHQKQPHKCKYCGGRHEAKKELCPAKDAECYKCTKRGHFSSVCMSRQRSSYNRGRSRPRGRSHSRQRSPSRSRNTSSRPNHHVKQKHGVHYVQQSNPEVTEEIMFGTVHLQCDSISQDNATATLQIEINSQEHRLKTKVDTGADGNLLPLRIYRQMFPHLIQNGTPKRGATKPSSIGLTAYNKTPIKHYGTVDIPCRYKDSKWYKLKYFVADAEGPAIIGLNSSKALGLVILNCDVVETDIKQPRINSIDDLVTRFPDQFDKIGNFKKRAELLLHPDARPSIDAPRKCSVNIKSQYKLELDKMEDQGIIKRVDHHTDWCSSMTISVKKDGTLRLCLDPKRLNQNLRRCPHKIPTLEEITPGFTGAKYFSKLDAKAGYWSIHLEEKSQELTTFRTPFGRYCFLRLPFGLAVSQDIFQQAMDDIISKVEGCTGIADDITVYGSTEEEHDRNLINLMETAKKEGLVFNSKKCLIKTQAISFFGNLYTTDGVKPDPVKVEDLKAIPTPESKDDLQRFLGLLNYLSSYIPHCADNAKPLRDLLKKDIPFLWQEDHQKIFENLKTCISQDAILQYYNPQLPTILEVDSSQKGLGACLVQEGKPVAFASKTLSQAQSNYSNIERETLALVFGIQRFHSYLFGKQFTVESDQRPLSMIWKKPLTSAPPRLQRLLIKVQGYDFDIIYKPGTKMILSDTLSRLPNRAKTDEIPLDLQVDSITLDDLEVPQNIALVNFGATRQDELQRETVNDPTLSTVKQLIVSGWPDSIKEVPETARPYWTFRDELGVSCGVLFKGRQVVIPETMRKYILDQLHVAHMGIEKTRRLAREAVYWPLINKDIEKLIKECTACEEHQPKQQKEPLIPHEIPPTPWMKLGTDLFELDKVHYLLITDYHSKYPVVYKLNSTTSHTIAHMTLKTFSMFGIPREIVSDNGPQYVGAPYQEMCDNLGIKHTFSSPRYARSNGLVERMVQTVKSTLRKCIQTKQDIHLALLQIRCTPIDSNLPSPAELLFGRPVGNTLPCNTDSPSQKEEEIYQHLTDRTSSMKKQHDKHSGKELPQLKQGQKVCVQSERGTWDPGVVTKVRSEPRSYEITLPNGSCLRRNRSQVRNSEIPKRVHFAPNLIQEEARPNTSQAPKQHTQHIQPELTQHHTQTEHPQHHTQPDAQQQNTTTTANNTEPNHTQQAPHNNNTFNATKTRSGRTIKKPARYKEE